MNTSLLPRASVLTGAALFGSLLAVATAAPTSTTETQGPTSSYNDQGTTSSTVTVSSFGSSYYGNGWSTPYYSSSMRDYTVSTQYRPIYYPPVPPALGERPPPNPGRGTLAKFSTPSELYNYLYEPFFAPLSTLLFTEDIDRRRRETLDNYRALRTAALAELHAKIDAVKNADDDTRQREFATLAQQQAASLAALEAMAEQMRANYVNGSWFQTSVEWNDTREWRLGDNTRWESNNDELKVVTAAAFFQEGLSPSQRRLLRELAMELSDSLKSPGAEISLDSPGPFFYFSPATARIRLPADLPAPVAAKITEYQDLKTALKRELRDVLYTKDRAFFESSRINALKVLALQQAPRLARVDQLAEEIRIGLAPLPNPARPPALPLPRELTNRISTYMSQKAQWQQEMVGRRDALKASFPDDRVDFIRTGSGFMIQLVANRKSKPDVDARRTAALAELETFNQAHMRSYAELSREKESIRTDVMAAASSVAGRTTNKTIDRLLAEFSYSLGQQELWEKYSDYEIAVLQPGLSPEQRRLLFGAALEKLDLPIGR